jgi:hypothetical protein
MLYLSGLLRAVQDLWNQPRRWSRGDGGSIKAAALLTAGVIGALALVVAATGVQGSTLRATAPRYEGRGGTPSPPITPTCGPAWTVVTSPDPGPTYNDLNGVTGSGNDVWAVGEYFNSAVVCGAESQRWQKHRSS